MPLVIITGFPSSGKSSTTKVLCDFLNKNHPGIPVHVVGECSTAADKNSLYLDSTKEKEQRSALKSDVSRKLNRTDVVILDSLNYIKGYRYELYCVAKAAQTPHCLVHCDITKERVSKWNFERPLLDQYSPEVMEGLVMRYEAPDSRNRWDAPLFTVIDDGCVPCEDIYDAIFHRKAPPPNMSTQSQLLTSTNFVYELDKATQQVISALMEAQKTFIPGDKVFVPDSDEKVELVRKVTLAELRRVKRQFISYTKTHPIHVNRITSAFVQFLNNAL